MGWLSGENLCKKGSPSRKRMIADLFDHLNVQTYHMAGAYWEAEDCSIFAFLPGRSMSLQEAFCEPPKVLDAARESFWKPFTTSSILLFRIPAHVGAVGLLKGKDWRG